MKKQVLLEKTIAIMLLSGAGQAVAATVAWDGGASGTGTSWNDPVNWSGDVLPGINDLAQFTWGAKPANKVLSLDAPQAVKVLTLENNMPDSLTLGTAADVSAGNTLTVSSVLRGTTSASQQYLDANIVLPEESVWEVNAGYNGAVTVRGAISGAAKRFVKSGSGTLTLSGDNVFAGDTLVNGGTLGMGHTNALGSAGTIFLNGGTLGVYIADVSARFSPETHYYSIDTVGTNASFATPLTGSDGQLIKRGTGTLTLKAANTYARGTTVSGGTLTFSGSGSLGSPTAPLTLSGGTLDLATASPVTVGDVRLLGNNPGTIKNGTLGGSSYFCYFTGSAYAEAVLTGTGVGLVKGGSGALYLYKANTYSGDTVLNTGSLWLYFNNAGSASADILLPSSHLVMNGATLQLDVNYNAGGNRAQTINAISLGKGASKFLISTASSRSGLLTVGTLSRAVGATLNLAQPTGNTAISANNGYATSMGMDAAGLLGGGYLTVNAADWATNNGVNIVAYTGYATLAGEATNIAEGATSNVEISNASTGTVCLAASAVTVNTLKFKDSAARTLDIGAGNVLRLGSVGGVLTPSSAGPLTITNGTLTAGGTDNAPGEVVFLNASTVTNGALIADNGTGAVALTKAGDGALVLLGQHTFSGGTFVNAGSLVLSPGVDPLPPAGNITVNGGTLNLGTSSNNLSGALLLRGGTLSNGTIAKSGSDYTIEGGTVSAVLSGPVGLVKTTSEAVSFTGANRYTGDTAILQGSATFDGNAIVKGNLVVGSPTGVLAASVSCVNTPLAQAKNWTVYPNGSLALGSSAQYVAGKITIIGGSVSGGQPYFQSGSSVEMTGGSLSVNAYITTFSITTLASSNSAVFSGTLRFNHPITVADGAAAHDFIFSGSHGGTGLTKSGPGLMVLTGFGKSYTGNTAVNAGTLLVNNPDGSSGTGQSAVSVAGGATLGGDGFIGGLLNYSNAHVTVTGSAAGATTNVAVVAPGMVDARTGSHIIGTLTVGNLAVQTNNVTFGAHSALKINVATNGACDRLVVNGTLSLATETDRLELSVAGDGTLPAGTYNLVTCQQLAAAGQTFEMVTGLPERGTLDYTATGLDLVVTAKPPKGTVIQIL